MSRRPRGPSPRRAPSGSLERGIEIRIQLLVHAGRNGRTGIDLVYSEAGLESVLSVETPAALVFEKKGKTTRSGSTREKTPTYRSQARCAHANVLAISSSGFSVAALALLCARSEVERSISSWGRLVRVGINVIRACSIGDGIVVVVFTGPRRCR